MNDMSNFFNNIGDKDTIDLLNRIRIGTVLFVDTVNATAMVEWLDKKGSRIAIPLSMPFCEQGWGIMTMPRKGTTVICGMRPYEYPIIIAYIPPNFMTPNSNWSQYKQVSGLQSGFDSGEIILRNMIDKAKCAVCHNTYTLKQWADTIQYNNEGDKIRLELCPNPVHGNNPVPALVFEGETIKEVNKIQMGILVYMQKDGKLRIKMNDGLDASSPLENDFTKGSIIDINFDDHSNLDIEGIQTLTIGADNITENVKHNVAINAHGDVTITTADNNKKITISADGNVEVTGNNIILNNGTKGVARLDDAVKVTVPIGAFTDSAGHTSPMAPTDVTGKITAASTTVKSG